MNKTTKIKYYIESLCIYDLKDDEIIKALYDLICNINSDKVLSNQSKFFNLVSAHGSLKKYISKRVLADDNEFTKASSAGKVDELSTSVINGAREDLRKLEEIASTTAQDIIACVEDNDLKEILRTIPSWETGKAVAPLVDGWSSQLDKIIEYHKTNGYGLYSKYYAFDWRDNKLVPITSINSIKLTDLKNYELQRQQVIDNTVAFLEGLPANNVLLYGDRGTGKSSTVHALLNEYKDKSLRMIEISKGDINDLTVIRELISASPMKFIIFIDDLSFDSHEDSFGELKAALEGSLSSKQSNCLIYATSNRRHLIKENFSDRENDVNRGDTLQEELSLSDRFGLSITFLNPNKQDYFDIVTKLAMDRGIEVTEEILAQAEVWALRAGGRSPRRAKQYLDYVVGVKNKNANNQQD